jgi:hypothetical protein
MLMLPAISPAMVRILLLGRQRVARVVGENIPDGLHSRAKKVGNTLALNASVHTGDEVLRNGSVEHKRTSLSSEVTRNKQERLQSSRSTPTKTRHTH